MIELLRTDSKSSDFRSLTKLLDQGLAITDGDEHLFYNQFNKIDNIRYVIIAYENQKPVGCGAIKQYDEVTMEVKRMFTGEECREKGIATKILTELEKWALELDSYRCILETGRRQVEAIALYQKRGYHIIENYGQYENVLNSICFEKKLE